MEREKLREIYDEMRACIEGEGYNCAGFELVSESGMNILRAYIDMPGGVDLSDCERVARVVTEYLDTVESALPERYYLEVSSLGLERPLFSPDDYKAFYGKKIAIKQKGGKKFEAQLVASTDNDITLLNSAGEEHQIPFSDIQSANVVYEPQTGQKKSFKKTAKKKK